MDMFLLQYYDREKKKGGGGSDIKTHSALLSLRFNILLLSPHFSRGRNFEICLLQDTSWCKVRSIRGTQIQCFPSIAYSMKLQKAYNALPHMPRVTLWPYCDEF